MATVRLLTEACIETEIVLLTIPYYASVRLLTEECIETFGTFFEIVLLTSSPPHGGVY